MRNERHVEYHETVIGIFMKYNPETLNVEAEYVLYKDNYDKEVSVLDLITKSSFTTDIVKQNDVRNSIYRGVCDAIKALINHFNADKKSAARRVEVVISHYGNLTVKAMDDETAAIDDLLRELNDNLSADISTLGMTEWVAQLGVENNKFKQLMTARYNELAKRPTVRMKSARKLVDKEFRNILDQIEALVRVNGIATYENFVRDINVVTERYKAILDRGKNADMKEEDEEKKS
ncbi:MAG: DUF6261 family protein [Prevotellaceae bacterium]|nr:DUF6261 family protein [Prevotellaceae bacterium]